MRQRDGVTLQQTFTFAVLGSTTEVDISNCFSPSCLVRLQVCNRFHWKEADKLTMVHFNASIQQNLPSVVRWAYHWYDSEMSGLLLRESSQ